MLLHTCHGLFVIQTAHDDITYNIAFAVNENRGGEGHYRKCQLTCLAIGIEIDVLIGCTLLFHNFLCGSNGILVFIQSFHVDADNGTALFLQGIMQLLQGRQLPNARTAAVEPEIYQSYAIVGKQAFIYGIAVKVLAGKGGKALCAVQRGACGVAVLLRQSGQAALPEP